MLQDYRDIRSRIDKEPKWHDEVGVPRYCKFHPREINDVYAREALLLEIACQNCDQKFKVAVSRDKLAVHKVGSYKDDYIIHYGDPPRHDDRLGDTMNCIDLKILQYWEREDGIWVRNEGYEIELGELGGKDEYK